jgi:hypothetical protein
MKGLLAEGPEAIDVEGDRDVKDPALIASGRASLIARADSVRKAADEKLTQPAEAGINPQAPG